METKILDKCEFDKVTGEIYYHSPSPGTYERVIQDLAQLRAQWSPELAQDVSAFHNIDAEAELTALLSEQVAAEIDREILRDLRKGAAWNLRWDYNGWKRGTTANPLTQYTQKDWDIKAYIKEQELQQTELVKCLNNINEMINDSNFLGD